MHYRSWGIECQIVDPQQIKDICPLVDVNDLKGGLWIPKDGVVKPFHLRMQLLGIAQSLGIGKIAEACKFL